MRLLKDFQLKKYPDALRRFINLENKYQVEKWGVQIHTGAEWMLFLTEEVGELADAISEHEYRKGTEDQIVHEAIQVVTLALKIAEMYYDRADDKVPTGFSKPQNLPVGPNLEK